MVDASTQNVMLAVQHMHEPEEDPQSRRRRKAAAQGAPEPPPRLLCLCQTAMEGPDAAGIQCECCSDWFHPRCMGMGQSQARNARSWICPLCAVCEDSREPLEAAEQRIKRTRRPEGQLLANALAEARALDVLVPEEALLERALGNYQAWQAAVSALLQGHQRQRELEASALASVAAATAASGVKPAEALQQGAQLVAQGGFMPTPAAAEAAAAAGGEAAGSEGAAGATAEPAAAAPTDAPAVEEKPDAVMADAERAAPAASQAPAAAPAAEQPAAEAPAPVSEAEAAAAPAAPQPPVQLNPAALLPERVIRAIVKQSYSVEVDSVQLQQQAVKMLRVELWLSRAHPLICKTSKGSVELLARLVK
jgi:hypothetical protein